MNGRRTSVRGRAGVRETAEEEEEAIVIIISLCEFRDVVFVKR